MQKQIDELTTKLWKLPILSGRETENIIAIQEAKQIMSEIVRLRLVE